MGIRYSAVYEKKPSHRPKHLLTVLSKTARRSDFPAGRKESFGIPLSELKLKWNRHRHGMACWQSYNPSVARNVSVKHSVRR